MPDTKTSRNIHYKKKTEWHFIKHVYVYVTNILIEMS